MPETEPERATEAFVAHYSLPKLLTWVALSGALAAASLSMAIFGADMVLLLVGGAGAAMFGTIAAVLAVRLFDRGPQVIIDSSGLYVRSHGEKRIPLRAIKTMRTDAHGPDMKRLCLILHLAGRYPIETRHRRFIYRINGAGAREFFGDVWIWSTHLDQPLDAIIRAIWAHRRATRHEKQLWELEDAAPGLDQPAA